jgi:hypothetical protein
MKEDEQELRELLRSWKPYYEFFHPQTGEVLSIRIPVNVDQLSDKEVAEAIQAIRDQKIRDQRKRRKAKRNSTGPRMTVSPHYKDGHSNGARLKEEPKWIPPYGSINNPYQGGGCTPK